MTDRRTGRPPTRPVHPPGGRVASRRGGALLLALSVAVSCSSRDDAKSPAQRNESAGDVARLSATATDSAPADSADTKRVAPAAIDTSGLRVVIALRGRALMVLDGRDTLMTAPAGIGMDSTLRYEGKVWNFATPRGIRRVLAKQADPKWSPPEWHYVEMAHARNLDLVRLPSNEAYVLPDSSEIVVRGGNVGLVRPGEEFRPFAEGEEIIWEGTLYIPPLGTRQRQVAGELGRYRLDLGDGYLLHGTPYTASIGQRSSHGCIRLGDDDIAWLYRNVPVGTPVIIR